MNTFKMTLDTMSKGMDLPRDVCWAIYGWMSVETRWNLFRATFPQPEKGDREFKRMCNWCFRAPIWHNCYFCQNYYCKMCISEHEDLCEIDYYNENEVEICKLCERLFSWMKHGENRVKRIKLEFY